MKEIQLFLVPAPGQKAEFLATVKPVSSTNIWDPIAAEGKIVLEGYTRDGWAWKPNSQATTTIVAESTDGRNKLPGFVGYLKQRQKSAYGRFGETGLWIVSYVQSKHDDHPNRIDCRIATDLTTIPNCNLQPRKKRATAAAAAATAEQQTPKQPKQQGAFNTDSSSTKPKKKGGGGLLGKLVGAQQRTNQHVAVAHAKPAKARVASAPGQAAAAEPEKTVQQVFAEFRQSCQDKMLDFDMSSDEILKVPISLKEHLVGLPEDEKPRVTMDVLKYMVYEAAEEVNEEWIAHKEPSEFMDETVICVYKEGAAPPEVLEEINKAELPMEVRGQQQHIQQERARQMEKAESKNKRSLEQQAHQEAQQEEDDFEALNANKRDRRTIEDYEREKAAKRVR